MKLKYFVFFTFLFCLLIGVSCKEKTKDTTETVADENEKVYSKGKVFFEQICATCHGLAGAGDGPASKALTIKPRNYKTQGFRAGDDLEIYQKNHRRRIFRWKNRNGRLEI